MKNLLPVLPPHRRLGWLLSLWLLLAGAHSGQAQTSTVPNPLGTGTGLNAPTMVRPDTATVRKASKTEKRAQAAADSAKRTEQLFGLHLTRPEKAGILALVPGVGQIYNHKYWKLPIVYGMVGGLGYWVYYQQTYYTYYRFANNLRATPSATVAQQLNAATSEIPNEQERDRLVLYATTNPNSIARGLEFYRRQRDLSILLSALGYGLQILDAVVDAHLYDFDVSDNLSLNVQPTLLPLPGQLLPGTGLALSLRVK
ncbi:MAG: DUF5683 domain-containing protein [Janthinobacterium lividum]